MGLRQDLDPYLNKELIVAMMDGLAYRGKLQKYDKETIVLTSVYETSTREVNWEQDAGETQKGYASWRKVLLPKVIIRIPMVMRIWPWQPSAERKK
jgi:small nuclear ribonucleoprotein (snRNP)-like protein